MLKIQTEKYGANQPRVYLDPPPRSFTLSEFLNESVEGGRPLQPMAEPVPIVKQPWNYQTNLDATVAFSVENLSEVDTAIIWFDESIPAGVYGARPYPVPTNYISLPPGTTREFPYMADNYSGFLIGSWLPIGAAFPGETGKLELNIVKTVRPCPPPRP